MTSHAFLWAIAQTKECQYVAVDVYRRLAASGDVRAQHKLAVLTGIIIVIIK